MGPPTDNIPTGRRSAVDAGTILDALGSIQRRYAEALAVDLRPLFEAFDDGPECETLAEQFVAVVSRLRKPFVGAMPLLFASRMGSLDAFRAAVDRMRTDALACAGCYNKAVRAHPSAGVAPLRVEDGQVELPLWQLGWEQARQRVFADLTGAEPVLRLESGEAVGGGESLAPRALLMTAMLRAVRLRAFRARHGRCLVRSDNGQVVGRLAGRGACSHRGGQRRPDASNSTFRCRAKTSWRVPGGGRTTCRTTSIEWRA